MRRAAARSRSRDLAALLSMLDELFWGPAWHGPSLRGAIRGVTPEQAVRRPGRGRHNIAELTVHAAYWKYAVRRRLSGDTRRSFPLEGSNWFARDRVTTASWRADVALLVNEHRQLCDVVSHLDPRQLTRRIPGSRWTNSEMIRGAAAHDIYHAGQIQLIKRATAR
jgi:uncharacterized damage-inducible protein DinB